MRTILAQIGQLITVEAQAMMAQDNRQEVQRENPPAQNMENMLQDLTMMNTAIFI